MEKILLLVKDKTIKDNLILYLDKSKYEIISENDEINVISYSVRMNPKIIMVHNSYLDGRFSLLEQLVEYRKFIVIYITRQYEIGYLYSLVNNPKFYYLSDYKIEFVNELLEVMIKDNQTIDNITTELDKLKEQIVEEKMVKKAKLFLIKKGFKEEEAYKMILKKAMDERITKKIAAKKIIEEGDFL